MNYKQPEVIKLLVVVVVVLCLELFHDTDRRLGVAARSSTWLAQLEHWPPSATPIAFLGTP